MNSNGVRFPTFRDRAHERQVAIAALAGCVWLATGCTLSPQIAAIREELVPQGPAPSLSAISPAHGNSSGGDLVTLTGGGFSVGMQVAIGGSACLITSKFSPTVITCQTTAGPVGAPQDVVVTALDDQVFALPGAFTYGLEDFTRMDIVSGNLTKSGAADGVGVRASYSGPEGIATDGTNFFVADTLNSLVREFNAATEIVTTIGGTLGQSGLDQDSTPSFPKGVFDMPYGVASDGKTVYVSDFYGNCIRSINLASGSVGTAAGTPNPLDLDDDPAACPSGYQDGAGAAVQFNQPDGLALTSDGSTLYIADSGNSVIRKLTIATGQVTTLAGIAQQEGSQDGPVLGGATFYTPVGLVLNEPANDLYVSDAETSLIRVIHLSAGQVVTLAGNVGGQSSAIVDGVGTAAIFNVPNGMAIVGSSLYIADTGNNAVRKMDLASYQVTTLLGSPTSKANGTGPLSQGAALQAPSGLAFSASLGLYVVDSSTVMRIH